MTVFWFIYRVIDIYEEFSEESVASVSKVVIWLNNEEN